MKNANEAIELVVNACEDRKAENCVVLNMEELTPIADYYIICHGNNERQVQAIARSVKETLEKHNEQIIRMEGFEQARWVLIDLGHIICHIFHKEERFYYNLERLWGDAIEVPIGGKG